MPRHATPERAPRSTQKAAATKTAATVARARTDLRAGSTRQGRRALALLVSSVVAVGVLFAFVLPARTYLGQRAAVSSAEERVQVLEEQNARLRARAEALRTDREVERLAREQYGMARRGEEAYAILPAPGQTAPTLPLAPPADDRSNVRKVVDALSFWD